MRAVGDDRADIAAADDAERLAENLDAEKFVLFPFAGVGRCVGFRDLPRQRQHQGDRMFGGGDRIAERRVHHDDAARGRRRDIDIVDADAGAADHFQICRALKNLGRDLGGGTDREPVEAVDRFGKFVLVLAEVGLKVDLEAAILEDRDGGGRQRVGDEDFGHGHVLFRRPRWSEERRRPNQRLKMRKSDFGGRYVRGHDGGRVKPPSPARPWPLRRPSRATSVSASISARSTVEPHQMRKPGGASR